MKNWQYFVMMLFVIGCSNEPAPEDSYFISSNSYNSDINIQLEDTSLVQTDSILLSDTLQIAIDSSLLADIDTLLILDDSLDILVDSVILLEDSIIEDTDFPANWHYIELEIQGSLYQSLAVITNVESDILGAHCVRNLVWEMNPWHGFIAGDSLKMIYTTEESIRENMVVAFEYIPVSGSSNHQFKGYVFHKSGDNWPSMWKPDGTELIKLLDRSPVRTFEEITSVFGEPRGNHVHAGVDFKAPVGTSVFSVTGGTVLRTNWNSTYNGHCIEIDFGGYSEIFLHLSSIDPSVSPGASIAAGQQVGEIGNTGISTAPHLHYQINGPDDYAIDPYLYFSNHRRTLGSEDMVTFSGFVQKCQNFMDN